MPFRRPPAPQATGVRLPPPPQDPPTLEDLYRAYKYTEAVVFSEANDPQGCSKNDAATGPAVIPSWFEPVHQRLIRLEARVAKLTNVANLDGTIIPFVVVPFIDGTDPTAAPHHLPQITSAAVIDTLSMDQLTAYLNGYGVPGPHPRHKLDCQRLVKVQIGCKLSW